MAQIVRARVLLPVQSPGQEEFLRVRRGGQRPPCAAGAFRPVPGGPPLEHRVPHGAVRADRARARREGHRPVARDDHDVGQAQGAASLPEGARPGLIISHGAFLLREHFTCHLETAISDGTPMARIDWEAVITALDGGRLPASGGEKRIVRIAASLAVGHPVSLRDAIPGLDQRNLELVTTAIRCAAGQLR